MLRASAFVTFLLVAVPASAQPSALPAGLDHPARAMALRPTGMALQRFEWDTIMWNGGTSARTSGQHADVMHYARNEWEARIPYESLLFEIAAGAYVQWMPGQLVVLTTNNVELGASFRDAPAPGWRYELGGTVTVPSRTDTTLDSPPPVPSLYPRLPLRGVLRSLRFGGWNPQRFALSTLALVPHARVEVDPIAELVLGLEVDMPILISYGNGGVEPYPQLALEIAGRFEELCLAGLRTELTSYEGWNVLFEPFVRLAFPFRTTDAFVRLALRVPVGPAYPFVTEAPLGYIGGALEGGILF